MENSPIDKITTNGSPWERHEFEAAVRAYLYMLNKQKAQEPYSKAEVRKEYVVGPLKGRSENAFERRMQNISAVLQEMGYEFINGYKPAEHIGSPRSVIREILKLQMVSTNTDFVATADRDILEKCVRKLLDRQKLDKPPENTAPVLKTTIEKNVFVRSPHVKAWVLSEAKGVCEGCGLPAPFLDTHGLPYLEVHHVKFLSKHGPDTAENAVALCPSCHRRAHYASDRDNFTVSLFRKVARLIRY